MFNDDEPPVSLFSFQDIITSLTGIMIFFLLLLSLNVLELTQKQEESSPDYQELERIKEKNRILQEQIDGINSDIRNYRQNIRNAQAQDEATLEIQRYGLEKKIDELKKQQAALVKKNKEKAKEYSNLKDENEKLNQEAKHLEQKEKENQELASKIEQRKKQLDEVKKALQKRRNSVEIMVDASIKKIPVVVECTVDRICIVDTKEKTRHVVSRKTPGTTSLVDDAFSHLRRFSQDRYYFVFLVKPSAVPYSEYLQGKIKQEMPNASYGVEPLLEDEGVGDERE